MPISLDEDESLYVWQYPGEPFGAGVSKVLLGLSWQGVAEK
jgi:hypothetical protein